MPESEAPFWSCLDYKIHFWLPGAIDRQFHQQERNDQSMLSDSILVHGVFTYRWGDKRVAGISCLGDFVQVISIWSWLQVMTNNLEFGYDSGCSGMLGSKCRASWRLFLDEISDADNLILLSHSCKSPYGHFLLLFFLFLPCTFYNHQQEFELGTVGKLGIQNQL